MKKRGFLVKKRAQVTLFIILAVIILAGIVGIYYLTANPDVNKIGTENPTAYIKQCIEDSVDKALPLVLARGGLLNPDSREDKSVLYDDNLVPFLCYSSKKETICEVNTPLLKAKIEEQLKLATEKLVDDCFSSLKRSYASYDYSESKGEYKVEILPSSLKVTSSKKISLSSGGQAQTFGPFSYEESSPIFDFVILTNKILNEEVSCDCGNEACRANVLELSKKNLDFEITLFVGGKDIEIYTIKDILTNQQFKFAVRNCPNQ